MKRNIKINNKNNDKSKLSLMSDNLRLHEFFIKTGEISFLLWTMGHLIFYRSLYSFYKFYFLVIFWNFLLSFYVFIILKIIYRVYKLMITS